MRLKTLQKRRLHALTAAALGAVMVLAAGCSSSDSSGTKKQTYNLKFANYSPPTNITSKAMKMWADDVEKRTDGRVKVEFFYSEALLPAAEILPGVGDGRADMGYSSPQYHPSEMPLGSLTGVPFLTDNPESQARTLQALYEKNAEFQKEFHKQGVHLLTTALLPSAIIVGKKPITALSDMKGAKIRVVGYQGKAFPAIGATPVGISQTEVYESLQRGVIDMGSSTNLGLAIDGNLEEVSKHFVDAGSGGYAAAYNLINLDLWNKLPADIKAAIEEANKEYMANALSILGEYEDASCQKAKAAGVKLSALPDAEVAKWKALVGDSVLNEWKKDAQKNGVADPASFVTEYLQTNSDLVKESKYVSGMTKCIG